MSQVIDWEDRANERRCSHCCRDSPGMNYPARDYLRVLQGKKGDEAAWLAHKVEPFFWEDAEMIHVRLCINCASRLGLNETTQATSTAIFT